MKTRVNLCPKFTTLKYDIILKVLHEAPVLVINYPLAQIS
jgi:hypothetical protein